MEIHYLDSNCGFSHNKSCFQVPERSKTTINKWFSIHGALTQLAESEAGESTNEDLQKMLRIKSHCHHKRPTTVAHMSCALYPESSKV